MSELNWYWVYVPYLDVSDVHEDSALKAGYDKVVFKSEADKVIAEMEENHKKEVEQLLMKIAGLEKLVETADKLLKPKGGFTVKDVKFGGISVCGG